MSASLTVLLTGAIALIALGARIFFYFHGKRDERKDIELEQKNEALEEVHKDKKRNAALRRNPSLRERLYTLYAARKD